MTKNWKQRIEELMMLRPLSTFEDKEHGERYQIIAEGYNQVIEDIIPIVEEDRAQLLTEIMEGVDNFRDKYAEYTNASIVYAETQENYEPLSWERDAEWIEEYFRTIITNVFKK